MFIYTTTVNNTIIANLKLKKIKHVIASAIMDYLLIFNEFCMRMTKRMRRATEG